MNNMNKTDEDKEFYQKYSFQEMRDFMDMFIDVLIENCEIVQEEYEKQLEKEDEIK